VTKLVSEDFTDWFMEALETKMRAKLGLTRKDDSTMHDVIIPFLDWATEYQVDYHRFLRSLGNYTITADGEDADATLFLSDNAIVTKDHDRLADCKQALTPWLAIYRHALLQEDTTARKIRMDATNPRFVLRNWIAQEVIDAFENDAQDDAIKVLDACLYACSHPFQAHYDQEIIERWIRTPVPEVKEKTKG
jgi:uncharacterized protein YdiU (UPF0061 family)